MEKIAKLQVFENQPIRSIWNKEEEEWYFSIVDVIGILTGSSNSHSYWRKLKERLKKEGNESVTNCHGLKMKAADGKQRLTDVVNTEQLLRIIQSVPSKKAEPFKMWLAKVGKERIDETFDPELAINRGLLSYKKSQRSPEWKSLRIQSIKARNELTDEWQERGIKGKEYGILTDDVTKAWSDMTTGEYKELKNLKKENLRDNMTMTELALNMLAEIATKDISQEEKPEGFEPSRIVACRGGGVAKVARQALEKEINKSVITSKNAKELNYFMNEKLA